MRTCISFVAVSVAVVTLFGTAFSQVATGTPRFASFGGGPFDTVNQGNLNVHFAIPVLHKSGRGVPFSYDLSYDSTVWTPVSVSGVLTWQPPSYWGWQGVTQAALGYVTHRTTKARCIPRILPDGPTWYYVYDNYVYHDMFGSTHAYSGAGITDCNDNYSGIGETAADGSGYSINAIDPDFVAIIEPSGRVTYPSLSAGGGKYTDANGNQITVNSSNQFFDTLSATTPVLAISGSGTPADPRVFSYTSPAMAAAAYKIYYTSYNVKTNFGCTNPTISEYSATGVPLVGSIALPDDTPTHPSRYTFTYEQTVGNSGYVTGRLQSVQLPTGGTITYTYSGGSGDPTHNAIACADGSAATLTRTLTPGADWIYARTNVAGAHWQTTVSTPADPVNAGSARDVTVIDFQKDSATGAANTNNFYETQRVVYQGTSGTTLMTTITCYNGNSVGTPSSCASTQVATPVNRTTVFSYVPDANGKQSEVDTSYNIYGLVTVASIYNYGGPGVGPLLQKTTTAYVTPGNGVVRPSSVTVQDNGTPVHTLAQTTYTYDEGTPTPTTGTPQHVAVTGARGNATTITSLVGSTSLTRHVSYYDTGTVKTSTDVNGAVTTYNYGSGNPSCNNSFPTSVTLPIAGLSQSMTWNCTGGVQTSATDVNGNTTYTNYTTDPAFWRPESVQDAALNSTSLTYTNQTQVESKLSLNSGNSTVDVFSVLDGLGRSSVRQQGQGPNLSNYDSVQQIYDTLGRPYQATMPYVGTSVGQTSPQGTPVTTTTYDALGRQLTVTDAGGGTVNFTYVKNDVLQTIGPTPAGENAKSKQLEYDGLGRLISVCEVTAGTQQYSSGACNQANAANGYLTTYTYDTFTQGTVVYNRMTVTQNAQPGGTAQSRTFLYDLAGRLVSEANPEAGTTTYVYDADSGGPCNSGTYLAGNLVKRTDAVGNVTCYSYDQLHRFLSVTYPQGSYSANTAKKYFVYDTATVNGVAMGNAKGRLAEAFTCTTACPGTKITDLGLSYSVRGEPTDVYESTPHSGPYYHVTASYWEHGLLKTLSGLPTLPTVYYGASDSSGLDGEGRIIKVTALTGQNPVTGVTYTNSGTTQPIGSVAQVTFGSLDYDNFTYDVTTGRLNQYQFHVASQTDTGVLTWNASGTLKQLAITDQMNSSNSQTCTFAHDDLSRIGSASCGTTWSQTFSLDPFGNISKSGTSSFLPTYNLGTNRFQSVPGGTPIYDANGNLTNDISHTYSWDAEGKALNIDTVGLTYDALGRMVEQARGSTYTEIVYGPGGGKLALMSGQTLQKAFVPLPAGATVVYTATGLAYYRHADWLGSARLASTPSRGVYYDGAYAPYGENYAESGTTDRSFTGQNQDTVSGLYDFLFREYHPVQGRWISPDPAGLAAVDVMNPQTWNRYAYVGNSPLANVDPLGLQPPCGYTRGGEWTCGNYWAASEGVGGGIPGLSGSIFDLILMRVVYPGAILVDGGCTNCGTGLNLIGGLFPGSLNTNPQIASRTPQPANNGTKVSCAGKTVLLPGNYRVQSNANGMITAVGIPLTGSYPYTAGPVTIAPNTIVGVGLEQNGALTVGVNNSIYYSAGFFGAYISSATYNNGAFTQVNGTRAVLGLPLSSSQTASGYLLNQFNQNSSLANTASLLQSVAQLGQMLVGCSTITGGS